MSFNPSWATQAPPMPNFMTQPPPRSSFRGPGTTINQQPHYYNIPEPPVLPTGPMITVFVGNISERIPDPMIKKVLQTCGQIFSWKRVSTFGFCEYDGPPAGARAVRLLHDLEIDGKKLVAKVDAKNKALLDDFREEETRNTEPINRNNIEASERKDDQFAMEKITRILADHQEEIQSYAASKEEQQLIKQNKLMYVGEIEPDKRELINKEIGKFRKYTEAEEIKREKEKDRKKRHDEKELEKVKDGKEKEKEKDKDSTTPVKEKDGSKRQRSTTPSRKEKEKKTRRRSKSREREEREKELAERQRERDRQREERERERQRERERERDREREMRERERKREIEEPKIVKNLKELQREKELEEEARDRKKAEKKAREKEVAYQERLKNWEGRERRRAKDYEKEREKVRCREEEREKEAKRLKEFLEDYDDERDDPKYYKGRELQRRLSERVREADSDAKDRNKEQEELDELKNKIFSGEFENPTQEFERLKKEREELYKPKILIDVNLEQSQQRERELERETARHVERERDKQRERLQKERYIKAQATRELAEIDAEPIESDSSDAAAVAQANAKISSPAPTKLDRLGSESNDSMGADHQFEDETSRHSMGSNTPSSPQQAPQLHQGPIISLNLNVNVKKKRLEVKDVFNMNDDENEDQNGPKKRKLVPLDYDDNLKASSKSTEKTSKSKDNKKSSSSALAQATQAAAAVNEDVRSAEEKRKHIKSIIDKIPTEKSDLFNYPLDWNEIDSTIEKKIRPWINKKIIEYIGEPEPTLVDFICSKVLAGSTPQGILDDVQMVLDEEAEVFVVKMWRLLIYEVEAKKVGISK